MHRRYREELRHDLRERRQYIAKVESLLDYIDELEAEVKHWKHRFEIVVEARSENDSTDLDEHG